MTTDAFSPVRTHQSDDPFRLGTRYVPRRGADGATVYEPTPLTQRDLLYPEEEDRVVTNPNHVRNCLYLYASLASALGDRADVRVFHDQRIDFQVPDLQPLGPDITVLADVTVELAPCIGTVSVKAIAARPLMVLEVTSPSTRDGDLDDKVLFYQRAGVPVYVMADLRVFEEKTFMAVMGYRLDRGRYVRAEPDSNGVLWVPEAGVGFKPEGLRLSLLGRDGRRVPDHAELEQQVTGLLSRLSDSEAARAALAIERNALTVERDAANARSDAAEAQRDTERVRAAALEAELRRLRGETP